MGLRRILLRRKDDSTRGLAAAVVPTLFLTGAFLLPLLGLAVLSLRPTDAFHNPLPGFSLDQYLQVLDTPYLWGAVVESFRLAVLVTLTCVVLAYPLAWYLARTSQRGWRTVVFVLVLSPLLTSEVVRALGWRILMSGDGPVNTVLQALRLTDEQLPLLTSPWTVYLAVVHVLLPFAVIALTTTLANLDTSLLRASADLGASQVRTFLRIVLPLSLPGLVAAVLIVFSLTMGIYVTPLMVGGGNLGLAGLRIRDEVLISFNQPLGAALSFVLLAVTLAVCALVAVLGRATERGRHA